MTCCGTDVVELVQYDTRPTLQVVVYDCETNEPVDLSDTGTFAYFLLKQAGQKNTKEAILMQKLPGTVADDGTVSYPPAYDLPGSGGRCEVHWSDTSLDTAGSFEGRTQVTWSDGTQQTSTSIQKLTISPAWGPAALTS